MQTMGRFDLGGGLTILLPLSLPNLIPMLPFPSIQTSPPPPLSSAPPPISVPLFYPRCPRAAPQGGANLTLPLPH